MRRIEISILYLGRYRIDLYDTDHVDKIQRHGAVSKTGWLGSFDCGSAGLMAYLSKTIFEPEHQQYLKDQKANSDAIGDAVIADMHANPDKYLPPKQIEATDANNEEEVFPDPSLPPNS